MVVVDDLDEGLDLGTLGRLLQAHARRDALGVAVDASNQSVAVLALALTLIVVLHDNGFVASESAVENDDDLAGLQTAQRKRA